MMHQLRSMLRVVCTVTALQLLASGPLAAQPACRSATLLDYYALGAGGCVLGGVRLTDFVGISDVLPGLVEVTPTISGDWIGFRMTGRLRSASPGGQSVESYQLGFRAQSALVSGIRTRVLGVTASGTGQFAAFGASSGWAGDGPFNTPTIASARFIDFEGAGATPLDISDCTSAIAGCGRFLDRVEFAPTALPFFSTRVRAETAGAPGSTALVTVEGHHAEFRVTVTPEPRAVGMLLMGVVMIGAIVVRAGRVRR